ncbi:hypothetical protein KIPB_005364 [Kipferlia bialata]|uniref:Uncharacterized protein n=1 Tax=Kipferlia bialata TaxID=797122 RepID=A0A9K3CVX4_9EUKA|nr:hypothetical protein KIPB_005364 [Kipferlia bialata]|eukprot:g5364.t1
MLVLLGVSHGHSVAYTLDPENLQKGFTAVTGASMTLSAYLHVSQDEGGHSATVFSCRTERDLFVHRALGGTPIGISGTMGQAASSAMVSRVCHSSFSLAGGFTSRSEFKSNSAPIFFSGCPLGVIPQIGAAQARVQLYDPISGTLSHSTGEHAPKRLGTYIRDMSLTLSARLDPDRCLVFLQNIQRGGHLVDYEVSVNPEHSGQDVGAWTNLFIEEEQYAERVVRRHKHKMERQGGGFGVRRNPFGRRG